MTPQRSGHTPKPAPPGPARLRRPRLATLCATLAIAGLTLDPTAPSLPGPDIVFLDKLWHALAFFGWAMLVRMAWRSPGWVVLGLAVLFGGVIELAQPLVGRDAEWADLAADLLGAAAGIWPGRYLQHRLSAGRARRARL